MIQTQQAKLQEQAAAIEEQSIALELKDKQITEQTHSVLEVKAERDKLAEENAELNLKVEKLLRQLFGRRFFPEFSGGSTSIQAF